MYFSDQVVIAILAVSAVLSAPAPEPAPAPGPNPGGLVHGGLVTTSVLTPNVVLVPAASPIVHGPVLVSSHGLGLHNGLGGAVLI